MKAGEMLTCANRDQYLFLPSATCKTMRLDSSERLQTVGLYHGSLTDTRDNPNRLRVTATASHFLGPKAHAIKPQTPNQFANVNFKRV